MLDIIPSFDLWMISDTRLNWDTITNKPPDLDLVKAASTINYPYGKLSASIVTLVIELFLISEIPYGKGFIVVLFLINLVFTLWVSLESRTYSSHYKEYEFFVTLMQRMYEKQELFSAIAQYQKRSSNREFLLKFLEDQGIEMHDSIKIDRQIELLFEACDFIRKTKKIQSILGEELNKFEKLTEKELESGLFTVQAKFITSFQEDSNIYTLELCCLLNSIKPESCDYFILHEVVETYFKEKAYDQFKKNISSSDDTAPVRIEEIDNMNGYQFEEFLGTLYGKMGYEVINTKLSGDQGADLLITKFGTKTSVQAKCYSNPVGNKAIQEVVASQKFYNSENACVVTNNYYTKSAIELAKSNGVMLIDRDKLIGWIDTYY